jgi:F420-0:gamma-glutamyl ligase-like protein
MKEIMLHCNTIPRRWLTKGVWGWICGAILGTAPHHRMVENLTQFPSPQKNALKNPVAQPREKDYSEI